MENIEYIVGGFLFIGVVIFVYKGYKANKNRGTGPDIPSRPSRPGPGRQQPK